jgi:hypothetical protein
VFRRPFLLVLVAFAIAAAPADASFSSVGTISAAGNDADHPQVAMAPDGDAVFTWEGLDGSDRCFGNQCQLIRARVRSGDGTLSTVQTLSDPGRSAELPQVAVAPNGDAVFVWQRHAKIDGCHGCTRVQTRVRFADGTLSPVQTLTPFDQQGFAPRVAVAPNGDAVIAWETVDETSDCGGSLCFRVVARARAADGTLSGVRIVSPPGQYSLEHRVGIDADGDAVFAWEVVNGTASCDAFQKPCLVQVRARAANGTLSPVQTLSDPAGHPQEPQLAVDPAGDAVVAWRRGDGTTDCDGHQCLRIETRTRLAGGSLSAVRTLSAGGQPARRPAVGVDAGGNAVFAWSKADETTQCNGGSCQRVQARTLSAGGSLSPVQTLSASGQPAGEPTLGVDAGGNAVFAWVRFDGTTQCGGGGCRRIQVRSRSAAGSLSTVQTLSASGQEAYGVQVGADPDGGFDPNAADAAAVWQRFDGSESFCCFRVQAAVQIAPPPF